MPSRQHAAARPVSLPIALAVAALAAAFAAPAAYAQYKWIDANGRVNYGDRPPPSDSRRVMRGPAGVHSSEAPAAGDQRLPYALRSATSRYPVVLYTAPDCAPCDLGRNHLTQRGVPYTEKLVQTAADLRAFNALQLGSTQFPVFTVGTDRMAGFEATMWNRMLDAAAYPRSSMLPPNYVARTLEPMSAPEQSASASDEARRSQAAQPGQSSRSAQSGGDVGSLLIPAQQQHFENPIRF